MPTANDTTLQYKCPCCGGYIAYNSASGKLKCPYCDTEFDPEALKSYDEDLSSDGDDRLDWDGAEDGGRFDETETEGGVYQCPSCGGELIADETTAAAMCPFCGNPTVFKSRLSGELKPDYVIPFKLDKEQAKTALKKHLEGRPLLPKVFKSENHIDEIKGIYVPFWLFDADAEARVRYRATQTRFWSDSRFNYSETRFFSVSRGGRLCFDRIPADGSKKMPDELMESLEPFDFSQAVDFQTAYLSGYLADKYDVPAEDCVGRVNERIKGSAQELLRDTVSPVFETVTPESSSISLTKSSKKYALYPVWLLNTTWKGNKYTFAMNGQTGKFVGDLPVDGGLFAKYFAGIAAAAAAVSFALLQLL